MNTISEVTRRNIFDTLTVENVDWSGRLEEPDFLSRIFNLNELHSYDGRFENAHGDIWQHRINNYDWEDNWIFTDDRFNLLHCDDSIFLQFLCEMIHPIVRNDLTEVNQLQQLFNEYLTDDNFEIVERTRISDKPVFVGRQKLSKNVSLANRSIEISNVLSEEYVAQKINIMEGAIETAPDLAIGTAKELIETICKTILEERHIAVDRKWDLPKLLKETNKELKLTPADIPDEQKASQTIKSILGSLSNVVQGICELRNHYGTGHGKPSKFKGLGSRHAKLSVGAASTLAIFILETHKIR